MSTKARNWSLVLIATVACATAFADTTTPSSTITPTPAETKNDIPQSDILKVSEAFGHFIGRNLNTPGIKFDLESIIKGMREGAAGKPAPMPDKEYEQLMAKIQEKALANLSQENLKKANDFFAKNAKEANIIEIQPGKLQYEILTLGSGQSVEKGFSPQIHYTGKFLDGSSFGSSAENGGPVTIPLEQTIQGFSQGIVGMKEGEKRRLFVHPELGYGTNGHLPPNSLLIFDIEVVKANVPNDTSDDDDDDDSDDDNDSDDDSDDSDDDDDDNVKITPIKTK